MSVDLFLTKLHERARPVEVSMVAYGGRCHAVFETRNPAQLAEFVGQIV